MARARLLKPGFFTNDDLGRLQPLTRLLFAGLWCIADREGRLEDRPDRIKAEVLPYDKASVSRMLTQLHDAGFVFRYEHQGRRYIQIVNFLKHQSPHMREPASTLPSPVPAPGPALDEHSAGTGPAPDAHVPSTASRVLCPIPVADPDPLSGSGSGSSGSKPAAAAAPPHGAGDEPAMDEAYGRCVRAWEEVAGFINATLGDEIAGDLEKYGEEWTLAAIREAALNQARRWAYVRACLETWSRNGRRETAEAPREIDWSEVVS